MAALPREYELHELHSAPHPVQRGLVVLQAVRLVDDQVGPLDLAQQRRVLQAQLEGGDEHVELVAARARALRVELERADDLYRRTCTAPAITLVFSDAYIMLVLVLCPHAT